MTPPAARTEADSGNEPSGLGQPVVGKEDSKSVPVSADVQVEVGEKASSGPGAESAVIAEEKMSDDKEEEPPKAKQGETGNSSSVKPTVGDGASDQTSKSKGDTMDEKKDATTDSTGNGREADKQGCAEKKGGASRRGDAEPETGDNHREEESPSPPLRSGSASPRRHSAAGGGDRDDESVNAESIELHDEDFDEAHVRNNDSDEEENEATNPEKLATAEPLISAPQDKMRMLRSTVRRLVRERKDLRAQLRRVRSALDSELRDLALRSGIKLPPRGASAHEGDEEEAIAPIAEKNSGEKEGPEPSRKQHEADDVSPLKEGTTSDEKKEGEAAHHETPPASSGAKRRRASEGLAGGNEETKPDIEGGNVDRETNGQEEGSAAVEEATSEPQRKKPRLVEIDPSQRRRSRNLFGRLMGHLQKAKETLEKEKDSRQNELQQAASQRITEKLAKDKEHLRAAKLRELMTANESLRLQLKKLNWEIEVAETQHLRYQLEGHYTHMQNFISTRAQPTIFWTPNSHTAATKKLQSQMSHDIEIKIAKIAQQTKPPTYEEFCAHEDREKSSMLAAYDEHRRQLREKIAAAGEEMPLTNKDGNANSRPSQSGPASQPRYRNPDIDNEDNDEDMDHEFDDGGDLRPPVTGATTGAAGGPSSGRTFGGGFSAGRASQNSYGRGSLRGGPPEFGNNYGRGQRSSEGGVEGSLLRQQTTSGEEIRDADNSAGRHEPPSARPRSNYHHSANFPRSSRPTTMGGFSSDRDNQTGGGNRGTLLSDEFDQSEFRSRNRNRGDYGRDGGFDRDDDYHARRSAGEDSGFGGRAERRQQRGGFNDDRRVGSKTRGDDNGDGDERRGRTRDAEGVSSSRARGRRRDSPSPSPKRRRANGDDDRRARRVSSRQRSPSPRSKNTW